MRKPAIVCFLRAAEMWQARTEGWKGRGRGGDNWRKRHSQLVEAVQSREGPVGVLYCARDVVMVQLPVENERKGKAKRGGRGEGYRNRVCHDWTVSQSWQRLLWKSRVYPPSLYLYPPLHLALRAPLPPCSANQAHSFPSEEEKECVLRHTLVQRNTCIIHVGVEGLAWTMSGERTDRLYNGGSYNTAKSWVLVRLSTEFEWPDKHRINWMFKMGLLFEDLGVSKHSMNALHLPSHGL